MCFFLRKFMESLFRPSAVVFVMLVFGIVSLSFTQVLRYSPAYWRATTDTDLETMND
jgi:hypothetical protein